MRPRATILVKLLLAFAVPSLALFALFGYVALEVTRQDLDAELGTRLEAVAGSASTHVRGKYLVELRAGDEEERAYQNVVAKLKAVSEITGARFYVFDREFNSRADSADGVGIGTRYYQAELDRVELERVFAGGTAASVTFSDAKGRRVKAGYAPVHASETEPEIVLAIGAEAPAAYFRRLDDLRDSLVLWGIALTAVVLAATFIAALLITRPVRTLAAAATRIGQGDLAQPIGLRTGDELGVLAQTMETMRGQLAERDARTQQMLAGIAHEVRNPLAGIQLYAGILRDELAGDERAAHAAKIDREVGYLERVVRDFLEYARRPPPELASVDAAALVREVADVLGADADAAGLEVEVDVPTSPLTLSADASQLRRALLNLGKNAIQAAAEVSERGKAVRLAARADGGDVELAVWNRGPSITAETSGRMFQPFFTTREKGTGLGLAFVAEIVRAHGGEVSVTSETGETTFRVKLPASKGT
ncbi:MAG TPA: HAMP domain-containing sensor histidine kinase [Kofleriaceae bacterium]|nr:HAMP domain-containing sensor histidine kinase [Kofleriaceae bacterium]